MGKTEVTRIEYNGWKDCLCVSNGIVDVILPTEIGIRVSHYGFTGGQNVFYVNKEDAGSTGGDEWRGYGGHRIWHGPQDKFRPNEPDNFPVKWEVIENGVRLVQNVEKTAGMEKQLELTLDPDSTQVTLNHRMYNRNIWPIQFTLWTLSMMKPGSFSVVPIKRKDTFYLPDFYFVHWPFGKANDERFHIGKDYITLKQDPKNGDWFKVGFVNRACWASCFTDDGTMFVKRFALLEGVQYPDYGCNYETYVDDKFLEIESLSPLLTVEPDGYIDHKETWTLTGNVKKPSSEAEMDEICRKYIL